MVSFDFWKVSHLFLEVSWKLLDELFFVLSNVSKIGSAILKPQDLLFTRLDSLFEFQIQVIPNSIFNLEPEKQIFLLLDILVDIFVLVGEVSRDDSD